MGAVQQAGEAPPLIGGDTHEAVAVCVALEQCLFHRIRVKEFGERTIDRRLSFSWSQSINIAQTIPISFAALPSSTSSTRRVAHLRVASCTYTQQTFRDSVQFRGPWACWLFLR